MKFVFQYNADEPIDLSHTKQMIAFSKLQLVAYLISTQHQFEQHIKCVNKRMARGSMSTYQRTK